MGLKRARRGGQLLPLRGFRRTFVGLKRVDNAPCADEADEFQTNPCGFEARPLRDMGNSVGNSFRRTLVGLKRRRRVPQPLAGSVSDEPLWV